MNIKLPEPTIVDGRVLYTTAQIRQYGTDCYAVGLASVHKNETPRDAGVDALLKIFKGFK